VLLVTELLPVLLVLLRDQQHTTRQVGWPDA
jgi:hypothetical protein